MEVWRQLLVARMSLQEMHTHGQGSDQLPLQKHLITSENPRSCIPMLEKYLPSPVGASELQFGAHRTLCVTEEARGSAPATGS